MITITLLTSTYCAVTQHPIIATFVVVALLMLAVAAERRLNADTEPAR